MWFLIMEPNVVTGVKLMKYHAGRKTEAEMGFGRGALLWILGVPIPIIILLALFWHQ